MFFLYEIKKIPYQFSFSSYEADKYVSFHFRLGTKPRKAGDWG